VCDGRNGTCQVTVVVCWLLRHSTHVLLLGDERVKVKGDVGRCGTQGDRLLCLGFTVSRAVVGPCRGRCRLALGWLDEDEDISTSGTRHARAVTNQKRARWRDRIK
jgi:hypothetical protein